MPDSLDALGWPVLRKAAAELHAAGVDSSVTLGALVIIQRCIGEALLDAAERAEAAESVLRDLAPNLGAGGYNAPDFDAQVFERQSRDVIHLVVDPLMKRAEKAEAERDEATVMARATERRLASCREEWQRNDSTQRRLEAAATLAEKQRADAAEAECARLREQIEGHCERIAKQSDLLSKKAERLALSPADQQRVREIRERLLSRHLYARIYDDVAWLLERVEGKT